MCRHRETSLKYWTIEHGKNDFTFPELRELIKNQGNAMFIH